MMILTVIRPTVAVRFDDIELSLYTKISMDIVGYMQFREAVLWLL